LEVPAPPEKVSELNHARNMELHLEIEGRMLLQILLKRILRDLKEDSIRNEALVSVVAGETFESARQVLSSVTS